MVTSGLLSRSALDSEIIFRTIILPGNLTGQKPLRCVRRVRRFPWQNPDCDLLIAKIRGLYPKTAW